MQNRRIEIYNNLKRNENFISNKLMITRKREKEPPALFFFSIDKIIKRLIEWEHLAR